MRDSFLHILDQTSRLIVENGPTLIVKKERPQIISVGIQGPPGEPGADGIGDASYQHIQAVPAASWTVVHNLNKKPSVTIVDSADTVVVGSISYTDMDSLVVTFSGAFSGKAYIN